MNTVCIIPARSGSKRIPEKNIRLLGGLPLVSWTIRAAQKSKVFDQIILSTDCANIANIGKSEGLRVESLRPSYLSSDHASASEVIEYHLSKIQAENVCYLQPTSPFRSFDDIKDSFYLFIKNQSKSVISVSDIEIPYPWIFSKKDDFGTFIANIDKSRSQDLNSSYTLNGAIYWFKYNAFFEYKTHLIYDKAVPYFMPKERSIDIDNYNDFSYAEFVLENKKKYD